MKILIVEVELNEYETTYYVTLNSENEIVWEDGLTVLQIYFLLSFVLIKSFWF